MHEDECIVKYIKVNKEPTRTTKSPTYSSLLSIVIDKLMDRIWELYMILCFHAGKIETTYDTYSSLEWAVIFWRIHASMPLLCIMHSPLIQYPMDHSRAP